MKLAVSQPNKHEMEKKQVVTLDALKRALACQSGLLIRGAGLRDYERGNVLPSAPLNDGHGSFVTHSAGKIAALKLADGEQSDAAVVQRLLEEPDSLVLALKLQSLSGKHMLVKKLRLDVQPALNVAIKLHGDDTGTPTVWYDEVPELLEPNETNLEWWIRTKLAQCSHADLVERLLKPLRAADLEQPLYAIAHRDFAKPLLVLEPKLREWLPRLPKDLAPLLSAESSELGEYGVLELACQCEALFALFGTSDTYLTALQY